MSTRFEGKMYLTRAHNDKAVYGYLLTFVLRESLWH